MADGGEFLPSPLNQEENLYYPDEIVEEVRDRNDIVDVIGSVISLKKKGANYFGLCPFHGEKTPSFSVSPAKQMFYCFGCGKGGDVIKFIMEYENLTFGEALKILADRAGVRLPERPVQPEERRERDIREKLLEINKLTAIYYYNVLRSEQGRQGMDYFRSRELSSASITHWGLGYADNVRDSLYRFLREKGYPDSVLQETGLFSFTERGVNDKFFNRVMFPIMDYNNRVIGFGGRVMGPGEPKYLNSPETKLFDKSRNLFGLNFARKSRSSRYILCEGYMDVISMHQAGFSYAVASLGTALTEQQARLISRYVKEVLLTYDSDGAGVKAAKRAMPILKNAGISCRVINMRPHKDPDEFIKAEGADAFQERIDHAENAFLWEAEVEKQNFDLQDPAGQYAYLQRVAELLCTDFSDSVERETYLKAVAREQMLDPGNLRKLVGQDEENLRRSVLTGPEKIRPRHKETQSVMEKSERQLITWMVEKPEIIDLVKKYISPEDFSDEVCREVLRMVYERKPANTILDSFRDSEELYEKAAKLLNSNLMSSDADEESFRQGLTDMVRNILRASVDAKLSAETDGAKITELFAEREKIDQIRL